MKKIIILLFLSQSCLAEIDINAGLSGAWHNDIGQGLIIDIIPANNTLFSGWFTYRPATEPSDNQYWFSLQGSYSGSVAELIIYQTNKGQFNQTTDVENVAVGYATLIFDSCTQARFV